MKEHTPLALERLNENTLIIQFTGDDASPPTEAVARLWAIVDQQIGHQLRNAVPASRSLLLEFELEGAHLNQILQQIQGILAGFEFTPQEGYCPASQHVIPVYYHRSVAPDLHYVAECHNLSIEAVIDLHTSTTYTVEAVGFVPGFAYMGSVPPTIATPRQATPRTRVETGSVGIAENQTGIYPRPSPGGWNIIGLTPTQVLHPLNQCINPGDACVFKTGDRVQFRSICCAEFEQLHEESGQ